MNVCRGTVFASVVLVERVRQHSVSRRRRRFGARLGGDWARHAPPPAPADASHGLASDDAVRRTNDDASASAACAAKGYVDAVRAPLRATRARVPAAHQPRVPREGHRRARGRGRVPGRAPSRRRTRPPGGRVRSPDRLHRRGLRHDVLPPPRGAPRPRVVRRDRPRGDRPREGARRERGPELRELCEGARGVARVPPLADEEKPIPDDESPSAPGGDGDVVSYRDAGGYRLVAADLRDRRRLDAVAASHVDPTLPTLVLAECCLAYLPGDAQRSTLAWAATRVVPRRSRTFVAYASRTTRSRRTGPRSRGRCS